MLWQEVAIITVRSCALGFSIGEVGAPDRRVLRQLCSVANYHGSVLHLSDKEDFYF